MNEPWGHPRPEARGELTINERVSREAAAEHNEVGA